MSESQQDKAGPELTEDVQELQAKFPNDAALQDAMSRLTLLGFDHADLSLPQEHSPTDTPDGAASATSDIDTQQVRTMASGLTGALAGTAIAATLATGGLAAPLVAAAAGVSAIGVSAATSGVGVVAGNASSSERDRLGAEGKLVLAVRVRSAERASEATAALRASGATDVAAITRASEALTRGVSSASWTGE